MAIIIISRGSYTRGKEVAEKVAQRLGYQCISREVLLKASTDFNIDEIKLKRAIEDAPSFLNRWTHGRERYIAYIQAALLNHLKMDNVVYHGFAGQILVRDLPWVLKVRVNASLEDRLKIVMDRDRVSRKFALETIEKTDSERRKWGRKLYSIDPSDPALYDLVFRIESMTVDDAVSVLCDVVRMKPFQITPEFKAEMDDLALAAEVRTYLMDIKPGVEVCSQRGFIYVRSEATVVEDSSLVSRIGEIAAKVAGLKGIEIVTSKDATERAVCVPLPQERPPKDMAYFTELG
jgi:cytidylate kinase